MVDHHPDGVCGMLSPPGAMASASTDYLQEVDAASTPKIAPTTPMQALQKPQQGRESTDALPSLFLGRGSELKLLFMNSNMHKPMPARSGLAGVSTSSKLDNRITLEEIPKESILHAEKPETKVFSRPTSSTGVNYDPEVSNAAPLYSPAPGEVAHDAYELYSKMFPSTCTPAAERPPSSTDVDVGLYLPSQFLEHMDNIQLLQPASYDQTPSIRDRCELNDDHVECGQKIKFAKIKEEDVPGGYLEVKKEPIFYEPSCTVGVKICSAAQSHGDTKHFQPPPESLSTVPCASNSGKGVHSIDPSGDNAGHGSQQPVGLKLFTSSVHMHKHKNLSVVTTKDPLPSTRALSKTPVQGSLCTDADWGRYLALSAMPSGNKEIALMLPFQERFKELQAFLKQCDEADQNECIQALRPLSAAARSGYAVELETRAIRLSLEEGATPHGPRLPAPGAAPTLKHVQ